MTRRFKRMVDFDLTLEIKNDGFIQPPREAQRNWLINHAMAEFTEEVKHLDTIAARMVPGVERAPIPARAEASLTDQDIMEDWQIPLMEAMADIAAATHGDVLEIGFGRGVSATAIQSRSVRSHTIVECNASVVERLKTWQKNYPEQDIRIIQGRWQDVEEQMGKYDAVFFHTYPLDEQEYIEQAIQSTTFAAHFFSTAAAHLRDGGVFTYMTNEIDSLSRAHQRSLLACFQSFTIRIIDNLPIPSDVQDAWWTDKMVVVKAIR